MKCKNYPDHFPILFQSLTSHGILPAIENCLKSDDDQTRLAVIEILSHVVDYNASLVREYALQESRQRQIDVGLEVPAHPTNSTTGKPATPAIKTGGATLRDNLLNVIIEQMFHDDDPEIGAAIQLGGICKILIDPENMMTATVPVSGEGF